MKNILGFLKSLQKIGICSVLFYPGWVDPSMCGKDLPVFPIVMGMDPESFVCYSLVLSYFLICFTPDQTQYCPSDALKVFSLKTLFYLCTFGGMVVCDHGRKGEH